MPSAPESATIPDQEQNVGGLPSIRPSSPETLFGAFGEGLQSIGEGTQKLSDVYAQHALKIAQFNNQSMADTANTKYVEAASALTEQFRNAHPNISPDNASSIYADYAGQIEQLRQQARGGLGNLAAQSMFDEQSRFAQRSFLMRTSAVMADGVKSYRESAFKAQQQTWTGLAATSTDPAEQEAYKQKIANNAIAYGEGIGLSTEASKAFMQNEITQADLSIMDSLNKRDPTLAWTYLQVHKNELTSEGFSRATDAIYSALYPDLASKGAAEAQAKFNAGVAATGGVEKAIIGQESQGNPGAVSVQQAKGIYQVTEPLFDTWKKPGQVFSNEADREDVAHRAMAHYEQEYNGDSARVAVAWFSGPGNVAPPGSPTPWIHNTHDANHVYVSQYVPQILGRMSEQTPGAAMSNMQANAPSMMATADEIAARDAAHFGLDPARLRDMVETKLRSDTQRTEWAYNQAMSEGKSQITGLLDSGGPNGTQITSLPELFKEHPETESIYHGLSKTDQHEVFNLATHNANQWTMDKQDEFDALRAKSITDPQGFLNTNPTDPSLNLTNNQRSQIGTLQYSINKKDQNAKEYSAKYGQIMNNWSVQNAVNEAGLKPGSPDISLFVGRMMTWMDNELKDPKYKGRVPDEMVAAEARQLLAKRRGSNFSIWPFSLGSAAQRPPLVPEPYASQIRNSIATTYNIPPEQVSAEDIGNFYEQGLINRGRR